MPILIKYWHFFYIPKINIIFRVIIKFIMKTKVMSDFKIDQSEAFSFSLSNQVEIKELSLKVVSGFLKNSYFLVILKNNDLDPILGLSNRDDIKTVEEKIKNSILNRKEISAGKIDDLRKKREEIINSVYSKCFK